MKLIVSPVGGVAHFCGDYDAAHEYPSSWGVIWVTQVTGQAASRVRKDGLGGDPRAMGIMTVDDLRYHRSAVRLLQRSAWTLDADVPLTAEQVAEWKAWRQAVRDCTKCADPNTYRWPALPSAGQLDPL